MIRLIRAEIRKLLSTKLWWGMLLGAVAFSSLGVVAQIASNGAPGNPQPRLSAASTQQQILASAVGGYIFSLVVGVILVTAEFRHFTSRPTFLIEPRRGRVIVSKLLVALGLGALYGIVCVGVAVGIAVLWLNAKGVTILWSQAELTRILLGAIAAVAIYAVVGVGIGVLLRNQIAAVMVSLAYLLIVEPLLRIIPGIKEVYEYFPGAAASAITAARAGTKVLEPWQGGLLLLGYGMLFAILGWVLTLRRDIP